MSKRGIVFIGMLALLLGSMAFATDDPQAWTGTISDSKCGVKHASTEEHPGGQRMTDAECTKACVKGGAKYVMVSEGKVYQIANQDQPDLATMAGQNVQITGPMNGDTITITKIEPIKQ